MGELWGENLRVESGEGLDLLGEWERGGDIVAMFGGIEKSR